MRLRNRRTRAGLTTCTTTAIVIALTACHTQPQVRLTPDAASSSAPLAASARLQHDIDALVAAPSLEHSYWGVVAKSLKTGDTLYALNAHKLLMPASTMKIVTMAAAAERLGWNYTYETRLLGAGPIQGGVLNGDLVVVGSGDPSIVADDGMAAGLFASWAERLKSMDVRAINGRIVGDDNAFDDEALGFGWSWDDLAEGFATTVGALQFNENTVHVTIAPGSAVGASAVLTIAPEGSGLIVANQVRTAPAGETASVSAHRLPGRARLDLGGSVPLGGGAILRTLSVDNPTLFFVTALRDALVSRGIDVRGPAVDIDDLADTPPKNNAVLILSYRSPPLSTLAETLMKESQNLYGETFLKTLGAVSGTPTVEGGRAATNAILREWAVPPGELIQMDGSGLSRYDYVTPDALVGILAHVDRDEKLRDPFVASLPIAGRDGTLAGRMKGTLAEGNARAKTGSMSNVRTLAGYVTTADGEPVALSILANNFETPPDAITRTIDAIVVRLARFSRR